MTIEPASAVRRATSAETGWFAAGGLLIAAALVTAVSVFRQWSLCDADPPSEACVTLRATMNMLPIQADTLALRVPWAAPLAALGLTLATTAWVVFLVLSPLSRSIKIFGAVVALPLVVMSLAGWYGVLSVERWVAHGGLWILIGTICGVRGYWLSGLRDHEPGSGEPCHHAAAGDLALRSDRVRHDASVGGVHPAQPPEPVGFWRAAVPGVRHCAHACPNGCCRDRDDPLGAQEAPSPPGRLDHRLGACPAFGRLQRCGHLQDPHIGLWLTDGDPETIPVTA